MKLDGARALGAAWVLAACSPANVGPDDSGAAAPEASVEAAGPAVEAGGPSADKACADVAYARCTRLQACSTTALQLRFGDMATCEATYGATCQAGLTEPSSGTTAAGQEGCAQAIAGWACADYLISQNPPPECQVAAGGFAAGGACAFGSQCQSAFCAIVPGAACGTCAAAPQPGDSCARLSTCGATLQCNTVSLVCDVPSAAGTPCAPGQGCVSGSECVGANATTGASGTCLAAVETAGSACSSATAQCDFFGGLTCDTAIDKCVAVQFSPVGGPCNFVASASEVVYCADGARCLSSAPAAQGTCSGGSAIGGPCDLVAGPFCVSAARCIVDGDGGTSGTCQVAGPAPCGP